MARLAVDFGTSNTVLARLDEESGEARSLAIPGVTAVVAFRSPETGRREEVHLVPSVIHYAEGETLVGAQVLSRGLEDHRDTVRWMKRSIAYGVAKRKRTAQGLKAPEEAGREFLTLLLGYAAERYSLPEDEFTFTVPVESFDTFRDWIEGIAEGLGIRRLRILDEPTAAVLSRGGAVRPDERFLIFDFGCGTLDVSVVRIDLTAGTERKAVQLGQAGRDLGGMDVDRWIADDFAERHAIGPAERREIEPVLLRRAEETKIRLSELGVAGAASGTHDGAPPGTNPGARIESRLEIDAVARTLSTTYVFSCDDCERGRRPTRASADSAGRTVRTGVQGGRPDPARGCLGCILLEKDLLGQVRETVDRALENAAIKAGVRRADISRVVVTGGSSLLPPIRRSLEDGFGAKIEWENPFDAVVRGACRGLVAPILQHDYAIESYDRERKDYEFRPLFAAGTEYPTRPDAVRLWAKGSYDGMTRIGIRIFEVSRMDRRTLDISLVDEGGALLDASRVASRYHHVCLNRNNPTFIVADPPVDLQRDRQRFLCSFRVDGTRRLLVTVRDGRSGRTLLEDHPVVRL